MPGFPVCHRPSELAQTHVHQVGDAIQSPHPLSAPSPPALSLFENFLCARAGFDFYLIYFEGQQRLLIQSPDSNPSFPS